MRYTPQAHHRIISDTVFEHDRHALFVGCGMGKTASVLHGLDRRMNDGATQRVLIAAPLRVSVLTWPDEIQKWEELRHLRYALLRTEEGKAKFLSGEAEIGLVNYEMLVKTLKWLHASKVWPDTIVFDESTRMKNPGGAWHRSFLKATGFFLKADKGRYDYRFPNRYLLTGTPMPNSLVDLFGQYRVLDGGKRLGRSSEAFKNAWFDTGYNGYTLTPRPGSQEAIQNRVKDVTLSLKSCDWLDIPPTHYIEEEVALPSVAREAYSEMHKELLLHLEGGDIEAVNAGALFSKLLQIASGSVYDREGNVHHIHDAKIKKLAQILKGQGNTLVLCCFKHEVERVLSSIKGSVRFATDRVGEWNRGKIKCMVAHPASLAHGLNLQRGGRDTAWFSLSFDKELYDQANARLARPGQRDETYVRHIVCPGTADDAVLEMLRRKDVAQGSLLDALRYYQRLSAKK